MSNHFEQIEPRVVGCFVMQSIERSREAKRAILDSPLIRYRFPGAVGTLRPASFVLDI